MMMDQAHESRNSLTVEEEGEGTRIDSFLSERVEGITRNQIQKLIRAGRLLVDGEPCKASTPVKAGQQITWPADAGITAVELVPEAIALQALFEDEDLLVLNKPPGLVVHPAPGHWTGTLVHGLLHRWPGWRAPGGALRPGIVHRLDRDTSGLMAVARSARAYASLREQIAGHSTARRYIALAWGGPVADGGEIDRPIGRDPRHRQRMAVLERGGKPAFSSWEVLARFDSLSLLRVGLRTGRTHQVRVHLASMGHPVFGDPLYGGVAYASRLAPRERMFLQGLLRDLDRTALHAYHLAFRHPTDGEPLLFEAPVPRDMERVLLQLTEAGGNQ